MTKLELLQQKWQDMSCHEVELRQSGFALIAGVDEAGRGPLAGPVTAAAVILPPDCCILGVDDSKKLSEKQRLRLEGEVKAQAVAWACVSLDNNVIDEINILEAAKLAMRQAICQLQPQPDYVLIDALTLPLELPQRGLIHGDALSVSIAAASIIAKSSRDRLMYDYDRLYPQYGFAAHKGYGTARHKQALRQYGLCPIHRRSFKY